MVQGEVWWVDGFGNAQTNISPEDLATLGIGPGDAVMVQGGVHASTRWPGWAPTGDAERGSPLIHADAHGLMTVAVQRGFGGGVAETAHRSVDRSAGRYVTWSNWMTKTTPATISISSRASRVKTVTGSHSMGDDSGLMTQIHHLHHPAGVHLCNEALPGVEGWVERFGLRV